MLFCFIALLRVGATPLWLVVLVLGRDFLVAAGVALAWALSLPLRMEPLGLGKAATAIELLYIGVALLLLAFDQDAPHLMLAAAATVSLFVVLSGLAYLHVFLRALIFGRRTA